MTRHAPLLVVVMLAVGGILSAGCAGKGEVITLNVQSGVEGTGAPEALAKPVRVVIVPFEDARPDAKRLGKRTHLWGGETYFTVPDGQGGVVVAQALAQFLTRKGWDAIVGDPAKLKSEKPPDITMTGTVRDFTANAKSRFGSTVITSALKADVRAVNTADGSTVRMLLNSARSQTVVWFEPEDVENLVTATVQEGVQNMMSSTKLDKGLLRVP